MRTVNFILLFSIAAACSNETSRDGHVDLGEVSEQLMEASGLVESVANPHHLWTLNDSDRPSEVYLLDEHAQTKMVCKLNGIKNRDWEDIAIGAGPDPSKKYLYVADIGDNNAVYPFKYIYRFEEPSLSNGSEQTVSEVEKFVVALPDGKRDSETIMIDPTTNDFYILSKREDSVRVYLSPYPFPSDTIRPKEMLRMPLTQIVSGSISNDGHQVLLKNYNSIFYWKRSGEKTLVELLAKKPEALPYDHENQGEAICWNTDGTGFYTLSESPEIGPRAQLRYYKREK